MYAESFSISLSVKKKIILKLAYIVGDDAFEQLSMHTKLCNKGFSNKGSKASEAVSLFKYIRRKLSYSYKNDALKVEMRCEIT